MNTNLNSFIGNRLKVGKKRRIVAILLLLVSPALFMIPMPMVDATIIWFVAIVLTPFFCVLSIFLELKIKSQLNGVLKAAEDKMIILVKPTILHFKLYGVTILKQTQFTVETANKKKYLLTAPQKEASAIYEAMIEVRNQRIYGFK